MNKKEMLPRVHNILGRRYGALKSLSGQGVLAGERLELTVDRKSVRCVIKASTGGRISFGKRDDGTWSGLDDSDFVVVVGPMSSGDDTMIVSMFDQATMKAAFDANQAAHEEAGIGHLPNWIALYHEEGRGPRGVGDGFGAQALWSEPLDPGASPPAPSMKSIRALTIMEAKAGLAKTFGVPPEAVEITIRG